MAALYSRCVALEGFNQTEDRFNLAAEIVRGAIQSIHFGQTDAGKAIGLTFRQRLHYVILPQAMRIAVPPTVGFSVQVVKGTALTSIIGFVELSKAGTVITNATFLPFTVYAFVALIYFALCWPLSLLSQHLERRLDRTQLRPVKVTAAL